MSPIHHRTCRSVLILALAGLCYLHAYSSPRKAQFEDDREWAFDDAPPELQARRLSILAEAKNSADEWAGRYMANVYDLTYTSLIWAPSTGYLRYRYNDAPFPFDVSYGVATHKNDTLQLQPECSFTDLTGPAFSDTFQKIRWGQRHFLIPSWALRDFCCAVNSTADDEVGRFLRKVESVRSPSGPPSVPPGLESLLNRRPITARVTATSPSAQGLESDDALSKRMVTLSAGRLDGVERGMAFWLADGRRHSRVKIRIGTVGRHSSTGNIESLSIFADDMPFFVKVGWVFRNRPAKRDRDVSY